MVPNGGILCLAEDPERAHGRDYHSGSEEQPDKIHYARKLTASGSELAIERMASNRERGGAETMVSQWTPISTKGTFYDKYTSSYVL